MVHSSSNSPMTTPSDSLHLTVCSKAPLLSCPRGATEQELKQTSAELTSHPALSPPTDEHRHVTTAKPSTKTSAASIRPQTQTSSQDQINGRRSARKRTPKACDCCGPNSKGHNVATSGRGRGRGRGRGASKYLGDTPERKPPQLTRIRSLHLSEEDIQKSCSEDDGLEEVENPVPRSQSPAPKPVAAITEVGPKNDCAAQTNGAALTNEDMLASPTRMTVAAEKTYVDKREEDPSYSGPVSQGAIAVRGRGRGAMLGRGRGRGAAVRGSSIGHRRGRGATYRGRPIGRGRGRGQAEMEGNQIKSADIGHVTSMGALDESASVEEPEEMQGVQTDHEHQKNSASGKPLIGNGELVHLSDSEEEMEEDDVAATEFADGVLKSATSVETSVDLDSEMQVDQMKDGIDQVSLPVPLPNGNVSSPRNNDQTSSPVEVEASRSAVLAPPSPITVSMEHSWALRDHRLYCHPTSWAKGEMLIKDQAENKEMCTDASNEESLEQLKDAIHEFLESFYIKYGSFIPLSESDVVEHLKENGNSDVSNSEVDIRREMTRYRAGLASAPVAGFMVTYNKHNLRLEDLGTLEDQNWLNDQIINMYGELIMDVAEQKVHFFNSFFYKQLVAKGYDGVKRWTKKVDLFSKWLLLIPIHLEIHWSLIAVTMATKTISYYDSQGIVFRHTTNNIMKYLQSEAREKKQAAFQKGWKIAIIKGIPQQKNDSDCGVFVLEYCRRLSVKQPLLFSQNNMPQIRKRIYKELCDCRLND
ncbi:sentrin-specific protease 5-like [Cyprinodon tularosa]|uniref:sentrin-specific protease 5-like n=1 Tax=Cyprinodon tularosa TaxID=77115 RepID=UPI0018E26DDE|nr:sentrin-specific protease 5-like [Cyprinodon tularosa]